VLDFPTKFGKDVTAYLNNANTLIDMFKECNNIKIAICPHSLYTVCPDNFRRCSDFSVKHGLLLHTHLAESIWEIDNILKQYNKRPVEILNNIGIFDNSIYFAHAVHLNDNEILLLGKKHTNIAHCMESNLKLASGFSPIKNY